MKPETLYKLTDYDNCTRDTTKWGENVTHGAVRPDKVAQLCTGSVIHAYRDPLVAVLLNPLHAAFSYPKLWEASGVVAVEAWDKIGCRSLTTIKQLPLPQISTTQKVAFAILCALKVCKEEGFVKWANGWLSGKDRSRASAAAVYAASAAVYAARAAVYAADAAVYAARAAVYAADAAAVYAADAAARAAVYAARAAVYAAHAAVYAADAAVYAAHAAARAAVYAADAAALKSLDVKTIAEKAMKIT